MAKDHVTHIYFTPVKPDRAGKFITFLQTVVQPAVKKAAPQLAARWKAMEPATKDGDRVVFALVFEGGKLSDWELQPILERALGAEEAKRAMQEWDDMLDGDQYGGSFDPVALG